MTSSVVTESVVALVLTPVVSRVNSYVVSVVRPVIIVPETIKEPVTGIVSSILIFESNTETKLFAMLAVFSITLKTKLGFVDSNVMVELTTEAVILG